LYFATNELQSNQVRENATGIGENGYASEPKVIIVSQEGQPKELHEFLAPSKNSKETLHSRFNSWFSWPWDKEEDGVSWLCHDNNNCDNTL
jgi:hypothetical protein